MFCILRLRRFPSLTICLKLPKTIKESSSKCAIYRLNSMQKKVFEH